MAHDHHEFAHGHADDLPRLPDGPPHDAANGPPHDPSSGGPDDLPGEPVLLPVRMLNEFTYCPRLFHFMHVDGRWADNVYTIEGRAVHRRVDQIDHLLPDAASSAGEVGAGSRESTPADGETATPAALRRRAKPAVPAPAGDDPPVVSRSVPLDSASLGLTAKLDLVSTATDDRGVSEAMPVETKRGRVPDNPDRSYEPERVQLMAQGLLLREHGYRCDHGVLYFAGSRTRVNIAFTPELESRTRELIGRAHAATSLTVLPPPLEDSPKCGGCSLNAICLPDETLALRHAGVAEPPRAVRMLYPPRDDALPFYVQEPGATVGKSGDCLIVRKKGEEIGRARLKDVSQLVLCGNISISAQTVHLLCEACVPIVHMSMGNWFYGITAGHSLRNSYDRAAQFAAAAQSERCLALARDLVWAKGQNQRTMLRRNNADADAALHDMADLLERVSSVGEAGALLGLEGAIAAQYFSAFSGMLKPRDFDAHWDFTTRNRRPPRDPVNALLSFAYSLLTKEFTVAIMAEGLDPWWGLYHRPRHGRPSLALDLMEPLRPLIADSSVVSTINTGMVSTADFTRTQSACMLNATGRKALIRAYESRLDQLVTHPVFDYRCSWRSMIRLHVRLFSRWLRGDIPRYESLTTR